MNNFSNTKRLTQDKESIRPSKSYQDTLSPDEIKKKLEEYTPVSDIDSLALNGHIRYIVTDTKTGKKNFRLGGFLTKIDKDYVVLSNGKLSWSVQRANTQFFRKLNYQELKAELITKISQRYEKQLSNLHEENKQLKSTLKDIKSEVKKKNIKNPYN